MMRPMLRTAPHAWIALLLAGACGPERPAPVPGPPLNVVLIVVDTLRRDHLGCYGYTRPTSPRIDELARESIRFTRATSQAPWTTPAIGAMLSSRYPSTLGIRDAASSLPDDALLLPEVLAGRGYATGAVISHSFCSSKWNFHQGFQSFDESNVRGHDVITSKEVTDRALDFVATHGRGPFFLWLHYFDPHFGYVAHEEWEFALEPGYSGPVRSGMKFTELTALRRALGKEDVAQIVRFYDSEIAFTDREIGRFLDGLRARGLHDRTVIVFTADHGEGFLDHGRLGHTHTLYAELVNVPLLVRVPGRPPAVDDRPAAGVDVFPTILDALSIEPPGPLAGISLLGPREESDPLRPVFAETESGLGIRLRSVTMGQLKLVRDLEGGEELLFDHESDPAEKRDLLAAAGADPELGRRLRALRHALDRWIEECRANALGANAVAIDPQERERLREIGYGE